MKRENVHKKQAFTLVEILTTIAIIAILLGFLIPALNKVYESALTAKQKVQFRSIEVALETFYDDMRYYPPSTWNTTQYGNYSASQRLAEALVGRDGFGFHQDSIFDESGEDATGVSLYMTHPDFNTDHQTQTEIDDNLAVRNGPYLELENANAVKLSNLYYGTINYGSLVDTYVLADMYKITKNAATGKLTGSPILYYKANKGKTQHDEAYADVVPTLNQCTYNVYDATGAITSQGIACLRPLLTKTGQHPMCQLSGLTELEWKAKFYRPTQNPNFTNPPRPYRAESFILQSAGPDSLYGTADDVFNFDSE